MHQKALDAFKSIDEVLGPAFAAKIRAEGPKFIDDRNFIQPICPIIVGQGRERVRDAVLALIRETMPKFESQRIVAVSEHPDELPSDASDDGSLLGSLNAAGFYSFSPAQFELPQISQMANAAYGPQPSTTKLAALIREFMRWDTDLYCILSPMDSVAWEMLAQAVMTGHAAVVGIESAEGEAVRYPEGGPFDMLPPQSFPVIDIDQGAVYQSLADAKIAA